jgi:hypothetical protein
MKKVLYYLFFLFTTVSSLAQHYYKDIVMTVANNKKHQLHRITKVKSIKFLSFDSDNNPIEGFSSEQQISKDYREVVTTTTTTLTGTTKSISYLNDKDQLIKTVDTIDGSSTTLLYEYDRNSQLTSITNFTRSTGDFQVKEVHLWTYNSNGKPIKMVKIKNDKDTTLVDFILDEKGNVSEEKTVFKGRSLPTVYYYYEDNNLTDIVRYNIIAKRLLPDYVFEYEGKNQLASMLVVPEEGSDYQKWYYSYDEDGLKILDACYSKTKQLIGRIEYQYEYYK